MDISERFMGMPSRKGVQAAPRGPSRSRALKRVSNMRMIATRATLRPQPLSSRER